MNGSTKLSPGASTAWNRPSRSITSACCCGTMRIVWMMTMIATMNSASVTAEDPSMRFSIVQAVSGGRFDNSSTDPRMPAMYIVLVCGVSDVASLLRRRAGHQAALPSLQQHRADDAERRGDQPLHGDRCAEPGSDPAACKRQPDHQQVERPGDQLGGDQRRAGDP